MSIEQKSKIQFIVITLIIIFFKSNAQNVQIYKTDDLLKRIHNNSDTTYIVNFWATWCKPCVTELPDFEQINLEEKNKPTKVLLVSLDFKEDLERKLLPFIKKNQYTSEVVLFDESNANEFINKIDSTWSGAIPATMITFKNKTHYHFIEKKINHSYLQDKINSINKHGINR